MAPATELPDDLTEEIFLCFHPADAVTLVRIALVCKRWCRLIADPGFHRRLRQHHRVPHMLGFSSNIDFSTTDYYSGNFYQRPSTDARFIRTSASCLKHAGGMNREGTRVVDTRHGLVLLHIRGPDWWTANYLIVWDPITKQERKLPQLPPLRGERRITATKSWNAAVFCTAAGCDHLDCHGKPFAVVFIATSHNAMQFDVLVYSSEAGTWREETYPFSQQHEALELEPSALVGNALYFLLKINTKILEYSIDTRVMRTIDLPSPVCFLGRRVLLMAVEDGGLGFATVLESKLYLWSMTERGGSEKEVRWAQRRIIDLKTLLPAGALKTPPDVVGYAYGVGYIFLKTDYGHFRIDLKSGRVQKVRSIWGGSTVFPYMSFHTPALGAVAASTDEGPNMGASSA